MYADKRFDVVPETTADPFSLASLIAWLELQQGSKPYDYGNPNSCLLAQYLQSKGLPHVIPDARAIDERFGFKFAWTVLNANTQTFGAALERARKLAAQR